MTNRSGEEVTRRGWPNRGCIVKNTGSQNESISSSLEHECAQKKFGVLRVTEGGDQNQYFFFLSWEHNKCHVNLTIPFSM